MKPPRHAIWDWNGTLLDDFEITASITISALAELGAPGVTVEEVRQHYRRPLADYFSLLLGRAAAPEDIGHLSAAYDRHYGARMMDLALVEDAVAALEMIALEASQSLLSMAPHEQLGRLIDHHGLRAQFRLIQGYRGEGHPTKRESLATHCASLGLPVDRLWLIGDTVDDYDAATAIGLKTILVATGMQSREVLERTAAPVVASAREAAARFLQQSSL